MKFKKLLFILCFIICFACMFPPKSFASVAYDRLSGTDRYKTAVAISRTGWPYAENVVLATGEDFPDALCAAPLAKQLDAPILLTEKSKLNIDTENEIERLGARNVYIIGGEGVISSYVKEQLERKGIKCTRLWGSDRYGTAAAVAKHMKDKFEINNEVVAVTGDGFADAISISAVAAKNGMPILLLPKDRLPDSVRNFVSDYKIARTYMLGGRDIISDNVAELLPAVERIEGNDKYDRNIAVLKRFPIDVNTGTVYFATGEDYPDALAGSAIAQKTSSPIVLIKRNLAVSTKEYINYRLPSIKKIIALGGESAVPKSAIQVLLNNTTIKAEQISLEYLGHSAFSMTLSNGKKILMDPWMPSTFETVIQKIPSGDYDLISISHEHQDHNYSGVAVNAQSIRNGSYFDILTVDSLNTPHMDNIDRGNTAYIFSTAGMRIVHLGDYYAKDIPDYAANLLRGGNGIDILMIPVGNDEKQAINASDIVKAVDTLKPRVIIPMHSYGKKYMFINTVTDPRGLNWPKISIYGNKKDFTKNDIPLYDENSYKPMIWDMEMELIM